MPHNTALRSSRSRVAILVVTVLALGLSLAACSSSSKGSSGGSSGDITIKDLAFTSKSVAPGATVTVKNNDTVQHTVTSDKSGLFDVTVDAGKSETFKAPAAGTYKFHCNIHSQMHGTLTVQ